MLLSVRSGGSSMLPDQILPTVVTPQWPGRISVVESISMHDRRTGDHVAGLQLRAVVDCAPSRQPPST